MQRRDWFKHVSVAGLALAAGRWQATTARAAGIADVFSQLADAALAKAAALGASFADLHIMQADSESLFVREEMVQGVRADSSLGCSVRVLVDGAWGFAATTDLSIASVVRLAESAVTIARAQAGWRGRTVEIETLPAHSARWEQPVEVDPFTVPLEEKVERLLAISRTARAAGADFCTAGLQQVRERKWLANSFGSRIEQTRIRVAPTFSATVTDPKTGRFASRDSLAPPRGAGWEHPRDWDFSTEAALAVEQAREKMAAPSVTPGRQDLVIAPSNLWLTIHETVGHPTELDRALGYEANFAGTSFCTPDKLDRLRYGSDLVTIRADRTAPQGLATTAFDDDGVETAGKEFPLIEQGVFRNFQTALGQAALIGRAGSNACAYADGFAAFPLQRMPNISLAPGPDPAVTVGDLIAGVEDGIYIEGNGSWSIDQQRYNFQFTGTVFHRIKAGRLDGMLRDVAYQGNSVDFWNSCDGLGGAATSELQGAFNCGKGQPQQVAPVSHAAVPARFRRVNILNTAAEAGRQPSTNDGACNGGTLRPWA